MPERIRIKARFADQCPLFKAGEGMTIELPGAVPSRCHAVCAASLHAFLTFHEMRKGAVDGKDYTCSWVNCRATMTVNVGQEFPEVRPVAAAQPSAAYLALSKPIVPPPPAAAPVTTVMKPKASNPLAAFLAGAAPKTEDAPAPAPAPSAAATPAPAPAAPPPATQPFNKPAAPPPATAAFNAPAATPLVPAPTKTKAQIASIVALLRNSPIFQGLPPDELDLIAGAVRLSTFNPGAVLLKSGDPGEKYFYLVTGKVDVVQLGQDGTEKVLSTLGAGQGAGEMSLLTGETCSATVRVTETIQALVITRAEFEGMLEAEPKLNRHFNKILADRLRSTNQKLTDVIQNGIIGKLGMFSLPELTQALAVSGRTGYLHLSHRNLRGYLMFRDGFCFNVRLPGKDKAEEAFLEMMEWREGEFRFEQSDISTLGLRPIDTTSLIMEGARRIDEKARQATPAPAGVTTPGSAAPPPPSPSA